METSFPLDFPRVGPTIDTEQRAIASLEYLAEHRVLVCKEHGYAVRNLKTHLDRDHSYPATVKRAVLTHFSTTPLTAPEAAPLPEPNGPPFECLREPVRAFLCDGDEDGSCGTITTRRDGIAKHCNTVHGWHSAVGDREHWREVFVQTFCSSSGKQRYFPVQMSDRGDGMPHREHVPGEIQSEVDGILAEFGQLEALHHKDLEVLDEAMAQTDQTGWWKKTGWVEHLKGSNLKHLARAARLPDKQDPTLRRAKDLVQVLLEECVSGLMTLPMELRRWLKSVHIAEVDPRPMGRLQNESSQDIYTNYWSRLVCYCLRVVQSEARSEHGETLEVAEEIDEEDSVSDEVDAAATGPEERRDHMWDARRLFPWRPGQKALAQHLLHSIESNASPEEQSEALLRFSETFIFQKLYADVFQGPSMHFLAVLGIDEESNRLRTGNDFSYMLAGVVYCTRVIALECLLPAAGRVEQGEAEFETFLTRRKEYLADGTMSPMSTMINLLAYGKYLAMNHGNAGSIFWEKSDRVMRLHSSRIVMDEFRRMVHKALADTERLLWQEVMWDAARFEMDLGALTDDVTFRKRDAYFVTNRQNGLERAWEWMVARMMQTRPGQRLKDGGPWHRRRAREYLRKVDQFRKLLLFCVHITGGQPARGPEILSLRFKNGLLQDRNVFVLDGSVMTVTRYHKTQSQWDVPKVVPRFLPWRVGQLMAIYLSYVQPFVERVSVAVASGCGWSEYVWADGNGPWETRTLTAVLQRRTGADLGVELGTLDYRHVAVGIGRKFVGDEFARGYQDAIGEVEEPEVETDDPLEQSAGRGSAVGVNRYAVSRDIVKHLSQRNMDTFRPLSESWHRFLGLTSRKDEGKQGKRVGEAAEWTTPTHKRFQTPVKKTGTMMIGGLATPMTGSSVGSLSSPMPPPPLPSSSPALVPATPPTRLRRMPTPKVNEADVTRAVRKALRTASSDAVRYRSQQQQEALERIMRGVDGALTVVLPTGGGKTLLFTAPACLEDPGVSIVVVPYRQLIDETVRDARAAGIACVEWTHHTEDPAAVVAVSADKLDDGFFGYASLLRSKGLLRRVFVDECHLAVTAHSWRSRLTELARVQTLEVPVILLTATLPVHMENDLERTMMVSLRMDWIRACTARRTTKYTVRANIQAGTLREEAIKVCRKRMELLRGGMKMVVYCRTKKECEAMAGELDCGYFYAGAPDNDEVLQRWKSVGGCVVATSALGTGVNYPGITAVVHVGMPYGLIDFAQESGRAGRGGEDVDSLILMEKDWEAKENARREARRQEWSRDEREMSRFVNTEHCRRLVLAEYFDEGEPMDCVGGEMARCDRCGSGVTDWQRAQQSVAAEKGMVQDTLDQVTSGCIVCWITAATGGEDDWLHDGGTCEKRREICTDDGDVLDMTEGACDRFRETVRYLDSSRTCFRCGISQKLCNTKEEGQGGCQWPGVAIPVVRMAASCTFGRNIIRQAGYEDDISDANAYARWLGQAHRLRLWREMASNSMVVMKEFLIYCRQEWEGRPRSAGVESVAGPFDGGPGNVDGETEGGAEIEVDDAGAEEAENGSSGQGDGMASSDVGSEIDLERSTGSDGDGGTPAAAPVRSRLVDKTDARTLASVKDVEPLRRLVDEWKELCVLCKLHGRFSNGHRHWRECNGPAQERRKMEEAVEVLQGVQFASFSQCNWCNRSQAMCDLWEGKERDAGWVVFTKTRGRDCTYGRWLLEAAAGLLAFRVQDGLEGRRASDPTFEELKKEMGRKERRGKFEFNGMFLYFYQWS